MTDTKQTILAIDDLPANLITLGAALGTDFCLQFATSGAEGLALAAVNPPDLFLLDVMMPEMDGYDVLRRLKADPRLCSIPVVFITAQGDSEAESLGLALGATDYISKPFKVEIARLRIKNLLERERLRKEVEHYRDHLEELVETRTIALSIAKKAAETASSAKTTFLNNMSHELRTPMNAIMGMTGLALRVATDSAQKGWLAIVERSSERLLGLIDDILTISNIEAGRFVLEKVDFTLGPILETLTRLVKAEAGKKNLSLNFNIAPELAALPLHGDPHFLGQIFLSLVDNAVKFTTEGSVFVSIFLDQETATDVALHFEVLDTGIGILKQDQYRVFLPFEQADSSLSRKYGGAGLGLAISKRLALAMDGDIDVKSGSGAGSCFWLTVPLPKAVGLALVVTNGSAEQDPGILQAPTDHRRPSPEC